MPDFGKVDPDYVDEDDEMSPALKRTIILVVVLFVAGGGWWGYRHIRATNRRETRMARTAEQAKLTTELAALQDEYREKSARSAPPAEMVSVLEKLASRQQAWVQLADRAVPAEQAQLEEWEKQRDNLRSQIMEPRITQLVSEGDDERAAGHLAMAADKYRQALAFQRQINNSRAIDQAKNLQRAARLEAALGGVAVEPLQADLAGTLDRAKDALKAERWERALEMYTNARGLQVRLDQMYPGQVDPAALKRIDASIASLRGASLLAESKTFEQRGDSSNSVGDHDGAAQNYQLAADRQREINTSFPGSRFVSAQRLDDLEVRRQTVLSADTSARLLMLDYEITGLLRTDKIADATPKLDTAFTELDRAAKKYPRSAALAGALKQKIAFLHEHRAQLKAWQAVVRAHLMAVPDAPGVALLASPVSQELYSAMTGANPSQHRGAALPVDSVTWEEARDFCLRVGWILGVDARLPTARELSSVSTAGGPAEWLDAGAAESEAQVTSVGSADTKDKAPERRAKTSASAEVSFRAALQTTSK